MPKWRSPLFSDIRNAVEDQVVFSMWKGRPYFRSFVMPAQPRTPPVRAERGQWRLAVGHWRANVTTLPARSAWARIALVRLITGFNQFMSQNRLSDIRSPATAARVAGTVAITITYTLGVPPPNARVYRETLPGGAITDITPAAGLLIGPNQTFTYNETLAGTFRYWIADTRALVPGDVSPQRYQMFCNEWPNRPMGTAPRAETIVT